MLIKTTFRKGIAMIELIFALVILGITLMSAPLLISQSMNSSIVTFQQESIAMAAAHTSALMTYAWDERNTIPLANPNSNMLRITPSGSTDTELDANATNPRRQRGIVSFTFPAGRSRFFDSAVLPPVAFATFRIGTDANGTDDDIDDFVANTLDISSSSTGSNVANQGEYIDTNITITNVVTYANDRTNYTLTPIVAPVFTPIAIVAGQTTTALTNVKRLTTTLSSAQLPDKQIVMRAFMCNIGAPALQNRPNK